jgi:capsular polysaccharide biosynthesis protein
MKKDNFFNLITAKKQTITIIVVIFILMAGFFISFQTFKYGTGSKLLVIQNFGANTDPYTASKSNEYLSGILSEVIYSNSFFTKVLGSGFNIDKSYFAGNKKEQMKIWEKTVSAKNIADTGMIAINVYHPDSSQAEQISEGIIFILQAKHSLYHGYGENVAIKIIDKPITSDKPVKPNLIFSLIGAIGLGLIFSFVYIYLFPERKYNLRFWPEGKRKIKIEEADESTTKNNWESVGEILQKTNYPFSSSWRELEEGKLEEIIDDREEESFGRSNLDTK